MMAVPLGPLASLLTSLIVVIMISRFSPPLLAFLALATSFAATGMFLHRAKRLPRWIMDILARLTDKDALQKAYESKQRDLITISAEELSARLKARVVGQDAAADAMAVQIRRRLAARRNEKPVAVFCLAGPPGVGKTHFAKVLAEELYGERSHLHFFDMSQFGQPHAAASLFGQARGYVGSTSYGALTAALRDTPNCVVLLDEFEKAHPDVHKRFLTAWNDGFITEVSDGARIATNEAIFVLTTNAASRRIGEIARDHASDSDELDRLVKRALLDAQFAPEVLSRIDHVFAFSPLAGLDIARVVALEIEALAEQFGLRIADGGIDPAILLDAIEKMQRQSDGGVRDIARNIERAASEGFIDARGKGASMVRLKSAPGGISVEAVDEAARSPRRNLEPFARKRITD